jgi:hypothetical protein
MKIRKIKATIKTKIESSKSKTLKELFQATAFAVAFRMAPFNPDEILPYQQPNSMSIAQSERIKSDTSLSEEELAELINHINPAKELEEVHY